MGDCRSTFAASGSALEPVVLNDIIANDFTGQLFIGTSPGNLTGPNADLTQWTATGGGAPNPTVITNGPSLELQNDAWQAGGLPTGLIYARAGGPKWRAFDGRILGDFTSPVPFP